MRGLLSIQTVNWPCIRYSLKCLVMAISVVRTPVLRNDNFLMAIKGPAGKGDGVVFTVTLFLGQHCPPNLPLKCLSPGRRVLCS